MGVVGYIRVVMQKVQIFNVTKGLLVGRHGMLAASAGSRIRGLLGRKSLPDNEALIIKPCSSIHTFFMHFSIDVLFLDKNMAIIKMLQSMPPNRLSPIVWASKMAIELPAGKIAQINAQVGDKIELRQL